MKFGRKRPSTIQQQRLKDNKPSSETKINTPIKTPLSDKPSSETKINTPIKTPLSDQLQEVKTLVDLLDIERGNPDDPRWIPLGIVLYKINPLSLLDCWVNFCRQSPKYTEGKCETKWTNIFGIDSLMANCAMGIHDLHNWAELDNPVKYVNMYNHTNHIKVPGAPGGLNVSETSSS